MSSFDAAFYHFAPTHTPLRVWSTRRDFHQHPLPSFATPGPSVYRQNYGEEWLQSGYEREMYQQTTYLGVYPAMSQPVHELRYASSILPFLISLISTRHSEQHQDEDIPISCISILFMASTPLALLFILRLVEDMPLDHPGIN